MQILVDLDGVLRGSNDEPIATGIQIVAVMGAWNQLVFMSSLTKDQTIQWLNVNKIVDYDRLIDSSVSLPDEELPHRQIRFARSTGNIDLFITNNPSLWAYAFEQGIPSIMFAVPSYTRVEFRPDAPSRKRAWADIEEAVNKQNALKTQDARLTRYEGAKFE